MLGEERAGMLDDGHGEHPLVVVVGELADVLHGDHHVTLLLSRQLDLEVLGDGGDQEAGQGVGGLPQHVADEGLGDIAADWEAEGGLCGDVVVGFLTAGGPWGRLGLEGGGFWGWEEEKGRKILKNHSGNTGVWPHFRGPD